MRKDKAQKALYVVPAFNTLRLYAAVENFLRQCLSVNECVFTKEELAVHVYA